MIATYNTPWLDEKDQIRFLVQDNATNGTDNNVVNASMPDSDIYSAFAAFGSRSGAENIVEAYASLYGQQLLNISEGPERIQLVNKCADMRLLAERIANGTVAIGNFPPSIQHGIPGACQYENELARLTGSPPTYLNVVRGTNCLPPS